MNAEDKAKKLDGKVIIITGANCGIGYETALDLASRNATVILACRDLTKGQEALNKIKESTKNENIHLQRLNLASLKEIKEFADNFKAKFQRLDVLINNAGLGNIAYQKTVDGFEMQFGVMHLGHFYLTNLLIDTLKNSAPSRIINVSSMAHLTGKINWDDLGSENGYNTLTAYAQAKLANILFTVELEKLYKDDGITSVCLHPGFVQTDFFRERENTTWGQKVWVGMLKPLASLFAKNPKKGAETSIYCAVSDEVLKHNGAYFSDCQVKSATAEATNPESAKRLWDVSWSMINAKLNN